MSFGARSYFGMAGTSAVAGWSAVTGVSGQSGWTGITTDGAGNWVAVQANSTTGAASFNDGASFSTASLPSAANWSDIAWGGGYFVAVANGSNAVAWSPNASGWTASTMPNPSNYGWNRIKYSTDRFIAIGEAASGGTSTVAAYSLDGGASWNSMSLAQASRWRALAFGNGVWVAAGTVTTGPTMHISTNPNDVLWTAQGSQTGTNAFYCADAVYGSTGGFIICGWLASDGSSPCDRILQSTDNGVNWTARTLPLAKAWRRAIYHNNLYYLFAEDGSVVTSSNGITWTQNTTVPGFSALQGASNRSPTQIITVGNAVQFQRSAG